MIKIDEQDIRILINLLEGNCARYKIINYIREYVYNPNYDSPPQENKKEANSKH